MAQLSHLLQSTLDKTIEDARIELLEELNTLQKHCARFIRKANIYRELVKDNMSSRTDDKLKYIEERVRYISLQSPPA